MKRLSMAEIAIIDDEEVLVDSLKLEITAMGHTVRDFYLAEPFLDYFRTHEPDMIFLDLRLPDIHGLEVLQRIRQVDRKVPTVIITAHGDMESAIQALKRGAFDYINKPFELDEIGILIERALKKSKLVREVEHHRRRSASCVRLADFIGESPAVKKMLEMVERLAVVDDTTIFLYGESGTGKDLLAKAIHNLSARTNRQFIEVNCGAIPENLLESELFGYEKGAFTDAKNRKIGLVELADGGTLFLDEVGDLSLSLQAKLLRFLESKSFRRIGGTSEICVDVRIISATNRDLEATVNEGTFRADLYYRLNVVPLKIPPLKARDADIITLAEHYLNRFSHKFRKSLVSIGEDAREAFLCYRWPGNVRELKNLIERMVILSDDGVISYEDLPTSMKDCLRRKQAADGDRRSKRDGLEAKLAAYERSLIIEALEATHDVKSAAADLLVISRYSLLRKLKRLFG